MRVLLSVKSAQMEEAVNALDRDQLDTLMKYIYRGFETPSEGSSGHLLAWHEKVHAVAGVGCIVRVLTDKKRVWVNQLFPFQNCVIIIIKHRKQKKMNGIIINWKGFVFVFWSQSMQHIQKKNESMNKYIGFGLAKK